MCWISISADGNDPDSPSIPYYTVFMSLWATLYLESWKRKEKTTALDWGMIDFESEEQSRPEFEAIAFYRESPVTGKQEKYFPNEKRYPVLAYSAAISSTFIAAGCKERYAGCEHTVVPGLLARADRSMNPCPMPWRQS